MSHTDNKLKNIQRVHLSTFKQADGLIFSCVNGIALTFETVALKTYFLTHSQRPIINCNCSYAKFIESMESYAYDTIFNNVSECSDDEIINIICCCNNLIIL